MLQAMEALERDQQGLATTNALLSLLNGLRVLPGRKAVVWLSEGLVLPERVRGTLRNVIAEANRDGVSFHLADAGGLVSGAARRESAEAGSDDRHIAQPPRTTPTPATNRAA